MAYDDERESWTEKAMVDRVKIELQNEGYVVSVEHRLRFRRRVDMVVFHNAPKVTFRRGRLITGDGRGDIAFIIEAKVSHELGAVGQLLADRIELQTQAPMVLLVPSGCYSQVLQKVCDQLGIEIWVDKIRGKKVIPLIGA